MSTSQTTPRTANMFGNIPSSFAPLDDRDDRTNHMKSALLVETLACLVYFSFTSSRESWVFYSADKCFETGADPHNIFDKQISKVWTPCLSAFYCVIPRVTLAWSLKACAIARFSKSARARTKNYREPPLTIYTSKASS